MQRIHLASDHAGFDLKATLAQHLTGLGYEVIDDGAYSKDSCDYPVFAHKLCEAVERENCPGILIPASGPRSAPPSCTPASAAATTTPMCSAWARVSRAWSWLWRSWEPFWKTSLKGAAISAAWICSRFPPEAEAGRRPFPPLFPGQYQGPALGLLLEQFTLFKRALL